MKVKELQELLSNHPADTEVVMSKDGEGNDFSPLDELAEAIYVADSAWSGEIYDKDDDPPEDGVPALVLWPTN